MSKTKKPVKRNKKRNIILYCFIILLITLSLFNISLFVTSNPQTVYIHEDTLKKRIDFWQNFLDSYPTYFNGWIELSRLQLKKGNTNEAHYAFLQAYNINPNSEEIRLLEKELIGD